MKAVLQYRCVFCLAIVFPLFLAAADLKTPAEPPTDISALDGVKIFDEKQYMEALKDVSIVRGSNAIYGNHARVNFSKDNNKRRLTDVVISDQVVTVSPTVTIYADQGHYNLPKDEITYTGKSVRLYGQSGTVFANKSLIYRSQERMAKALGAVEVQSHTSPHKLFGEEIRVYFKKNANAPAPDLASKSQSKPAKKSAPTHSSHADNPVEAAAIERLEADGAVRVVLPGKVASGDHAKYLAEGNIIELWGNVSVTDDKKQLTGAYAIVYKDKEQSEVYADFPKHLKMPPSSQDKRRRVKIVLLPG